MPVSRQALSQAHPAKTNVLSVALTTILILVISMQIWLLCAALNTSLAGNSHIAWHAFYASLALFAAGSVALQYLPQPIRRPLVVEREEPFANAALAWRTLAISIAALTLSFAVWFMWSAIAVKLNGTVFGLSKNQLFWLAATPVILGSLLRIPYGMLVSRFGSRRSYAAVTLLLLVPVLGTGFAVQNPKTPYGVLLFWSALTGIAGANFATSMGVVTLWFPKKLQGSALGINGLGNLGVTIAQYTVPVVLAGTLLGGLTGAPLTMTLAGGATVPVYLQNAAFIWVPFILLCSAAIWFGTRDFPMEPKTLGSQLAVARNKHTWITSFLYFLTFGCFVAMGASLPLMIQEIFAKAPGGAPNPLVYAPLAPLVATLMRPLGGTMADKFGAGRMTAIAVGVMALGGFSLSQFLDPADFRGFFTTIMIICAASGFGNGSVFKIIPSINPKEAGSMIGVVSCIGALGGFFPPLILAQTIEHFGSPAVAYTAMAVFGLTCFSVNWWYYWREGSPTRC